MFSHIQQFSLRMFSMETYVILHGSKERSVILYGSKEARSRRDYFHKLVAIEKTSVNHLSPYLTGMRQTETSSQIVRDYYGTKISDINKTFMLQSY